MNKNIENISILIYDFALVAGTTYVIVNYNWSLLSYVLTVIFWIKPFRDE